MAAAYAIGMMVILLTFMIIYVNRTSDEES